MNTAFASLFWVIGYQIIQLLLLKIHNHIFYPFDYNEIRKDLQIERVVVNVGKKNVIG